MTLTIIVCISISLVFSAGFLLGAGWGERKREAAEKQELEDALILQRTNLADYYLKADQDTSIHRQPIPFWRNSASEEHQ